MKRIILLISLSCFFSVAFSQKKIIDTSVTDTWPIISPNLISNDGNYVSYTLGNTKSGNSLIIQSAHNDWKKEIQHANSSLFTQDSKFLIYKNDKDTLTIIELGKENTHSISKVSSFKVPTKGDGEWLAYQLQGQLKKLVLRNVSSGKEIEYINITDFLFSRTGSILLLKASVKEGGNNQIAVIWCDLKKETRDTIYRGSNAINFSFDQSEKQLAFIGENTANNITSYRIWRYGENDKKATLICDESTPGLNGNIISSLPFLACANFISAYTYLRVPYFSEDGNKIFFAVQPSISENRNDSVNVGAKVSIWDYNSEFPLSSKALIQQKKDRSFLGVIKLKSTEARILQNSDDIGNFYLSGEHVGNFILTKQNVQNDCEKFKPQRDLYNLYSVSTENGSRILIKRRISDHHIVGLSLTGKYAIWYDRVKNCYFSYNTKTATTTNITNKIKVSLCDDNDHPDYPQIAGVGGWLKNDEAILIYDKYDIWQVDPDGKKSPVNITGYFGRRHNVIFRNLDFSQSHPTAIDDKDSLLLSAFNVKTKCSAFLKVCLNKANNCDRMHFDNNTCYFPGRHLIEMSGVVHPFFPLKATNCNAYLVEKMSALDFPNLFTTDDFINYKPLTSLTPQKDYNWFTNELVHWKMFDRKFGDGILYKPQNFNPNKKYPLIVFCYEQNTDALNWFLNPTLSDGDINIPFFTSRGYLVFVPDISYKPGYIGQSAYNVVVSGAKYLTRFPWVNAHRIGLQGSSFGGFETNYILTRTNLFAAACAVCGSTDLVSQYGELMGGGTMHEFFQIGQGRIGATLWQRPDLYIKNSPVFKANLVNTPLLIMHNKDDERVDWHQAIEWVTALQQLGKKVALLDYEGEGHGLFQKDDKLDFTIRLQQFFDHYLKQAPAPAWLIGDESAFDKSR